MARRRSPQVASERPEWIARNLGRTVAELPDQLVNVLVDAGDTGERFAHCPAALTHCLMLSCVLVCIAGRSTQGPRGASGLPDDPLPADPSPAAPLPTEPRKSMRTTVPIEYAQWSAYDLARLGGRHSRVHEQVEEPSGRTAALTCTPCRYFKGRVPPKPFQETYLKRPNPRSFFCSHQGFML